MKKSIIKKIRNLNPNFLFAIGGMNHWGGKKFSSNGRREPISRDYPSPSPTLSSISWCVCPKLKPLINRGVRNCELTSLKFFDNFIVASMNLIKPSKTPAIENHDCDKEEQNVLWRHKQDFLEAIENKYPRMIFTDQDPAIGSDIKEVFPNTVHQLCEWHIAKNAAQKIPHLYDGQKVQKKLMLLVDAYHPSRMM